MQKISPLSITDRAGSVTHYERERKRRGKMKVDIAVAIAENFRSGIVSIGPQMALKG